MKKRLLLIGAGPTSSLIAYNIKKCSVLSQVLEIHVWEKSRGVGGRFSTSKNPSNPNSYLDLGAQYLTKRHSWSRPYFENLEDKGLIKPLDTTNIPGFRVEEEKKSDYVCSKGTGSIVKNFFEQANVLNDVRCNMKVSSISKGLGENGQSKYDVTVETDKASSTTESFDIVISTIPIPQILQLQSIDALLTDDGVLKRNLQNVKYSSRYALGLFYNENIILNESEHIINFVQNDVIRYWSLENMKRAFPAKISEEPAAITIHTSIEFGSQHENDEKDSQKDYLLEKARQQIKTLNDFKPDHVKCHKWKYSQVLKPYVGSNGMVEIGSNPIFILSGDGMSYSGFEGCIFSAEQTVKHLQGKLKG